MWITPHGAFLPSWQSRSGQLHSGVRHKRADGNLCLGVGLVDWWSDCRALTHQSAFALRDQQTSVIGGPLSGMFIFFEDEPSSSLLVDGKSGGLFLGTGGWLFNMHKIIWFLLLWLAQYLTSSSQMHCLTATILQSPGLNLRKNQSSFPHSSPKEMEKWPRVSTSGLVVLGAASPRTLHL